MKYFLTGIEVPLDLFDGVEVSPVEEVDGDCSVITEDCIGDNPNASYYWSVYLHYDAENPINKGFGGVDCVIDLPTREAAEAFGRGLLCAIQSVRG